MGPGHVILVYLSVLFLSVFCCSTESLLFVSTEARLSSEFYIGLPYILALIPETCNSTSIQNIDKQNGQS